MKTILRNAAALLLSAGLAASAHAGTLTYQGVTFTTSWSGNLLTLEIDAANPTGDWSTATSIGALQLKDLGSFSDVTQVSAPGAATGWTLSSNELNANGCGGGSHAGMSLCYSGAHVALADDLVFQFRVDGGAPNLDAPHLKVNFFGDGDRKVGSLLSQTIAPVPEPQTYALFLGGLGVMGWMARRRRKQA
ncbi:MAG: PEP-CTERM sorting domain-containing protein [Pseudomonadota bacterium]